MGATCSTCCTTKDDRAILSGCGINTNDEESENIEIRREMHKLKQDLMGTQSLNVSIDSTNYNDSPNNELSVRKVESKSIIKIIFSW